MKQWQRFIWPFVLGIWTVLMVSQIILAFIYYNHLGSDLCCNIGWLVLAVSAVFGWLPILVFRRKGGVPEGKSYVQTTVLVDSGIYAIVRHPQYLAGLLINLALIFITQHWLVAIIGVTCMILIYIDAMKADKDLIEKFGDDYKRYMQRVPRMNFLAGIIRLLQRRRGERETTTG